MNTVFDWLFNAASQLLAVPLLFVLICGGLGMLSGQSSERAIGGAVKLVSHVLSGLLKAVTHLFGFAVKRAESGARNSGQSGRTRNRGSSERNYSWD
jgi:hypothetical protein